MKKLQVDRFEEEIAVLTDRAERKIYDVPKDAFGFELHEGDLLAVEFSGDVPVSAEFLAEETAALKKRIKELMEKRRRK